MQYRSVRLLAVFAVIVMVATPFAAVSFESDDSDAAGVDYTKYYYDQLEVAGKWIYDQVVNTTTFTYEYVGTFDKSTIMGYSETDFNKVSPKLIADIQDGIHALSIEQPKAIYWLKLNSNIATTSTSNPSEIKATVTLDAADYSTFGTNKTTSDAAINTALSTISSSIGTGNIKSKVTYLHDTLCGMLTYDIGEKGKSNKVRSLYTAIVGDGHVVCEGYAKAFKALCDYNNIPCLIITGIAGTGGDTEGHMWNYVKLENDCWYLVDATWDDQSSLVDTYLMAGTETVGFNSTKIKDSHNPSTVTTDYGFTIPVLSSISADEDCFIITYMSEGKEFMKIAVEKNQKMSMPVETPTKEFGYFYRWCTNNPPTSPYDWNNVVTGNMTLYAQFLDVPTVSIYLVDGDHKNTVRVAQGVSTELKGLLKAPADEGKKFLGWNTAKDGSGIYYTEADTVNLVEDMTLYAVYESTSDNAASQAISKLNEFLAGDSVIPGVNNTVFLIAVCSGVLLLIGFLLIRIKK